MDCSTPSFSVHHQLPELAQTHIHWVDDATQPSHPLSFPSPPTLSLSQHQSLFQWVGSLHQVAKVLELQLQHQSFQWIIRIDVLQDWLVWSPGCSRDSQESSPAPQFESISSSVLRLLYGPTRTSVHDYWKNHNFDYTDLCWQSEVFAFNTLSRFKNFLVACFLSSPHEAVDRGSWKAGNWDSGSDSAKIHCMSSGKSLTSFSPIFHFLENQGLDSLLGFNSPQLPPATLPPPPRLLLAFLQGVILSCRSPGV